jgi:polysaccharide deacetylase 2 family uncharacterized protein YibQ
MTMSVRKRKGTNKKILFIFFAISLPMAMVGVVLLGLYCCFWSGNSNVSRPPPYEEIYIKTTPLSTEIRKIDYAIHESLYRNNDPKGHLFFSSVHPRHQNGYVWDFTELSVKCASVRSALELQRSVVNALIRLGSEITVKAERQTDDGILCHVFAKGLYTHRIIFEFDHRQPFTGDARPKIAIIIDDLGYDADMAASFIQLDLPLSFSVLPSAPFTQVVLETLNGERHDVMLHLPMEPKDYPTIDPGPGALLLSMDEHEIRDRIRQDLSEVPESIGVNNHMGSSFTEHPAKMRVVLEELKKRSLFYVDSRTSNATVGFRLARKMGIPTGKRSVFLDHELTSGAMKIQMERLFSIARQRGAAIGIAHPHPETLKALKEFLPTLRTEFQVVPVSELLS